MSRGPIRRQRIAVSANTWESDDFKDRYKLLWAHVTYTASATVGNRNIRAILINEGTEEWDTESNVNITAGQTRHFSYMPGVYRETSFVASDIQLPFPVDFVMLPGDSFKVYDANDVDASGDSMVITYRYEEI